VTRIVVYKEDFGVLVRKSVLGEKEKES
jgi:hypothetical protein